MAPHLAMVAAYIAALPLLEVELLRAPGGKAVVPADIVFVGLAGFVAWQKDHDFHSWDRGLLVAALLPVATALLAAVAADGIQPALPELLRLAYSMFVLVFLSRLRIRALAGRALARAWTWTAVAVCALGFASAARLVLFGLPRGAWAVSDHLGPGVVRLSGLLPSNTLVQFLVVALPFVLICIADRSRTGNKVAYRLALPCLLVAGTLTFSRGLMGLAVAFWLCLGAADSTLQNLKRLRRPALAFAIAATVVALVTGVWQVFPVAGSSLPDTRRADYWVFHVAGVRMLRANLLLGVGPDAFGRQLVRYSSEEERRACWPPLNDDRDYDPHSFWIGRAAETGLAGLASWCLLFWTLAKRLGSGSPRDASSLPGRLISAALFGLLLNGIHFDFVHLKFVWAALGLAMGEHQSAVSAAAATETIRIS